MASLFEGKGRSRKAAARSPFAVRQPHERKNSLVLASSLAIAVAVALTGTLVWLVMARPDSDAAGLAVARAEVAAEPSPAPAVLPAVEPSPSAAPVQEAVAQPGEVRAAEAAESASPPLEASADVTAAIVPPAEELREIAVSDPDAVEPLGYAPEASPPAPTPAPRLAAMASRAPDKPVASDAPKSAPSMQKAVVRKAVNMRASGQPGSKVLTVIPANSSIEADLPCQHWCLVSYKGQRGYIYKDFLATR